MRGNRERTVDAWFASTPAMPEFAMGREWRQPVQE